MSSKIEINYVKNFALCDRDHFYIVKGISIVAALVAYVCGTYWNVPNMHHIVWIAAAVFAMCSGYGVSESFRKKGSLVHYWENKMIKVWLPSLVVMVISSIMTTGYFVAWVTESPIGLKGDILYVIFGGYLAFWMMFQFAEKLTSRIIGLFAAAVIAFVLIPDALGVKTVLLAFPVGVMFSQLGWKYKIRKFTWKGSTALFMACGAVGTGIWLLAIRTNIPYLTTALWSISYMAIGAALIFGTYAAQKIPVFGVFVPFGFGSYALYLVYAEVFTLLNGQSDWRAAAMIGGLLCIIAAVLTALRELLILWNRNLRRRKNTRLKGSMW